MTVQAVICVIWCQVLPLVVNSHLDTFYILREANGRNLITGPRFIVPSAITVILVN